MGVQERLHRADIEIVKGLHWFLSFGDEDFGSRDPLQQSFLSACHALPIVRLKHGEATHAPYKKSYDDHRSSHLEVGATKNFLLLIKSYIL